MTKRTMPRTYKRTWGAGYETSYEDVCTECEFTNDNGYTDGHIKRISYMRVREVVNLTERGAEHFVERLT